MTSTIRIVIGYGLSSRKGIFIHIYETLKNTKYFIILELILFILEYFLLLKNTTNIKIYDLRVGIEQEHE